MNSSGTSALNGVATTNNSGAGDLFEVSGGDLVVNAGSIANASSIEVKSTATLELQSLTLTNTVGGVHGSVTVDSGGILDLERPTSAPARLGIGDVDLERDQRDERRRHDQQQGPAICLKSATATWSSTPVRSPMPAASRSRARRRLSCRA